MPSRYEVPDTLIHGFSGGEIVLMPDATECQVAVLGGGRVVNFDPVDPSPRGKDGEKAAECYRLGADGSIIRHLTRDSGLRGAGREEPTGWTMAEVVRLDSSLP